MNRINVHKGRIVWQLDFIDPATCLEFLFERGWTTGNHGVPETLPTSLFWCIEFSLGRTRELEGCNIEINVECGYNVEYRLHFHLSCFKAEALFTSNLLEIYLLHLYQQRLILVFSIQISCLRLCMCYTYSSVILYVFVWKIFETVGYSRTNNRIFWAKSTGTRRRQKAVCRRKFVRRTNARNSYLLWKVCASNVYKYYIPVT